MGQLRGYAVALAVKPVLSHYQAAALLDARAQGSAVTQCSLDLGRSESPCELNDWGATSGEGFSLAWDELQKIAETDNVCFVIEDGAATPARSFSEASGRTFHLWPTEGPPALMISGFVMHRVRDVNPIEGAELMVRALGRTHGRLLDTTTGLGYAAICAARTAREVVTIEVEPNVVDLAGLNPWSSELFDNPRIERLSGDCAALVESFAPGSFAAVLHDPPAINLAGDLYSATFYESVRRVLTRGGRFFHYVGDPASASGGRTTRGVMKRLRDAGFSRVAVREEAFGVLATV
jgi:predicted methyltransferase